MKKRQKHRLPSFNKKAYLIFSTLSIFFVFYVFTIYPFLVVNKPVKGDILVVEGWIPPILLDQAAELFRLETYEAIIAVGGPSNRETADRIEQTYAYRCKQELMAIGVPAGKIATVPVWHFEKDRTATMAKTVALWLKKTRPSVKKIDVFTASVHGRKSWLLYRRAFGASYQVGIISASSEEYKKEFWLSSKYMAYRVLRNTIGYIYALLFTF